MEINHQRVRCGLGVRLGPLDDLDPVGVLQTKRPVAQVDVVAAQVGKRASGEVPPLPPTERMMRRVIRNVITGWPQPEIVIKAGGNFVLRIPARSAAHV